MTHAPEQLEPVLWKVWHKSDLSRVARGMTVTRLQAMIVTAKRFGSVDSHGDPILDGFDAEVVREGEEPAKAATNRRAAA